MKHLLSACAIVILIGISAKGGEVTFPVVGGEIPASFIIALIDSDATALSNDDLPSSLEILSFGYHRVVKFTFIGSRQLTYSTWGIITSGNAPISHSDTGRDGYLNEIATNHK